MATTGNEASKGVFLNGKAQMIQMLQQLDGEEKEKLLRQIALRNPAMAKELREQSVSINQLSTLQDHYLRIILSNINSQILGIALKGCNVKLQKRVLSLASREYAEEAYSTLVSPEKNDQRSILRAQEKVLSVVIQLMKRSQVIWN